MLVSVISNIVYTLLASSIISKLPDEQSFDLKRKFDKDLTKIFLLINAYGVIFYRRECFL